MDTSKPVIGDYIFLRRRKLNLEFIEGLPKDCVERVGRVAEVAEDGGLTIEFPHGVMQDDGTLAERMEVPAKTLREDAKAHVCELLYPPSLGLGEFGTVLCPTRGLYTLNWDSYKRRRDLMGASLEWMIPDIRDNGLRHPIVLDAHMELVFGSKRLAACFALSNEGMRYVECYIVAGEREELQRSA